MINLNDLKNEINSVPIAEPVFLYIGVGAAAYDKKILPLEHYQQFPPFLQDMYNKVPNLHLFLLLIDPYHENPPYVATQYKLEDPNKSECHYRSDFLQTFVYRLSVYTDADLNANANGLNITPMLRDLNQFAKEKQISLLYHDFTGRKTALLAEHFDGENKEHLDQIIYGMSAREDHGCFFDLTLPTAYFPYKLDYHENKRPIIKMFNYYYYLFNNRYPQSSEDLQTYPKEMHPFASAQKQQMIQIIRTFFKTTNLSVLRQVRKLQLSEANAHDAVDAEDSKYLFNDLPKLYREMFTELYKEKNYNLLFELLFNYSSSELDLLAQLKDMDMSGEDLLTFITLNEDPYKWYNDMNEIMI
jgi:hypothetical protein